MKAVLLEFSLVFVAIHDVDASSAVGSRLRPTWQSGQGGSCRARQLRAQTFCAQALQFRVSCIHKHTFSHAVPLSEYGLLMFVDCYHFHIGDFRGS